MCSCEVEHTHRRHREWHHSRPDEGGCCLAGGQLRGFIQPCLLVLLLQEPSHGYGLMERLKEQFGLADADPGLLYRTLRGMERDGFVQSAWDTEGQGPARRTYRVTGEGIEFLDAWAAQLQRMRTEMDRFLATYQALGAPNKES